MGNAAASMFPRHCLWWLYTCLAVLGIVSWSQGFRFQTGDTISTEYFARSNSVWKPAETGRRGLPSVWRGRSSGIFSTSTMLTGTGFWVLKSALSKKWSINNTAVFSLAWKKTTFQSSVERKFHLERRRRSWTNQQVLTWPDWNVPWWRPCWCLWHFWQCLRVTFFTERFHLLVLF